MGGGWEWVKGNPLKWRQIDKSNCHLLSFCVHDKLLFQTPVSDTTGFVFPVTPEKVLLSKSSLPLHHSLAGTSHSPWASCVCMGQEQLWLLWHALGELWAATSVSGPLTVPQHVSQQLHRAALRGIWRKQGKDRETEEVYSILFSPFPPPPSWAAVAKKISYWMLGHPMGKAVIQTPEP